MRSAEARDLDFLRDLFAATLAADLASVPWPDAAKARLVDRQFALQHRHFLTRHPAGDFLIVTRRAAPVGRLYLDRSGPCWRLVDIIVATGARGDGLGTLVLRGLQDAARSAAATGIALQVRADNPRAARLYAALGFTAAIAASATHRRMIWSPTPDPAQLNTA